MHLLYVAFITDTFTWGLPSRLQMERCSLAVLAFVEGEGESLLTLALSLCDDKWVDLSISAVTFIKEIWPSSGESSDEL